MFIRYEVRSKNRKHSINSKIVLAGTVVVIDDGLAGVQIAKIVKERVLDSEPLSHGESPAIKDRAVIFAPTTVDSPFGLPSRQLSSGFNRVDPGQIIVIGRLTRLMHLPCHTGDKPHSTLPPIASISRTWDPWLP